MSASLSSSHPLTRPLTWLGAVAALLVLGTLALWAHYGTAVFFEMVRAGWVACF
jgi:hypothetical protein